MEREGGSHKERKGGLFHCDKNVNKKIEITNQRIRRGKNSSHGVNGECWKTAFALLMGKEGKKEKKETKEGQIIGPMCRRTGLLGVEN